MLRFPAHMSPGTGGRAESCACSGPARMRRSPPSPLRAQESTRRRSRETLPRALATASVPPDGSGGMRHVLRPRAWISGAGSSVFNESSQPRERAGTVAARLQQGSRGCAQSSVAYSCATRVAGGSAMRSSPVPSDPAHALRSRSAPPRTPSTSHHSDPPLSAPTRPDDRHPKLPRKRVRGPPRLWILWPPW